MGRGGGGGCWPAGGGRGGGQLSICCRKRVLIMTRSPCKLNFVEFHSVAISASECSSSRSAYLNVVLLA